MVTSTTLPSMAVGSTVAATAKRGAGRPRVCSQLCRGGERRLGTSLSIRSVQTLFDAAPDRLQFSDRPPGRLGQFRIEPNRGVAKEGRTERAVRLSQRCRSNAATADALLEICVEWVEIVRRDRSSRYKNESRRRTVRLRRSRSTRISRRNRATGLATN
jgi:hypothetical protein